MSFQSYIVMFKKEDDHPAATDDHITSCAEKVKAQGGEIKHMYTSRIARGFAGTLPESLKSELEKNDAVKSIEVDGPVSTQ